MEGDKSPPFYWLKMGSTNSMASIGSKLEALIKSEAEGFNLFVVGSSVDKSGTVFRFMVDAEGALTMELLGKFTRHISKKIDEGEFGEDKFRFEISSPGADKPLVDVRQFGKHLGRTFKVQLKNGDTFEGKLKAIDVPQLVFEVTLKEKGKKPEIVIQNIDFGDVQQATIKIAFN